MKMTLHSTSAEEMANGFRQFSLCLPFESLLLQGPDRNFSIRGVLVQEGESLLLRYMALDPEAGDIPDSLFAPLIREEDWWSATGKTWDGYPLTLIGLQPPWNPFFSNNEWGSRSRFSEEVQRILVHRADHVDEEDLRAIFGDTEAAKKLAAWKKNPDIHAKAILANTRLRFTNTETRTERKNAYFEDQDYESRLDSLTGVIDGGVKYCVRQEGSDVALYIDSLDTCSVLDVQAARRILNGLITAYSFMHGGHLLPWRVELTFNGHCEPDELSPKFRKVKGHVLTCRGKHESGFNSDLARRMIECAANYFARDEDVVTRVKKYLWQMHTSKDSESVTLYECLHLCAVLEGLTKFLLGSRAGWGEADFQTITPKGKKRDKTAMELFEAVAVHYGIPWVQQFEEVAKLWKKPRNSLAHGDMFNSTMSQPGVLFDVRLMVGGGIVALMLREMGWNDPLDFKVLKHRGALYFAS